MSSSQFGKSIVPVIEAMYGHFTTVERNIADFFIKNREKIEFSSKNISQMLYVSEASLSRFAKKCGYKGYREFLFYYQNCFEEHDKAVDGLTQGVLNTYQELLNKSYSLIDEDLMRRAARMLGEASRVHVYGMGSSGMSAQEFKIRFMRMGVEVEAVNDSHLMRINTALVREGHLVIGMSISGKTEEVIYNLCMAKERGAQTLLITSNNDVSFRRFCDEIMLVGVTKNLEAGNVISPQFPILIMVDIFFAFYLSTDYHRKNAIYRETLSALQAGTTGLEG